MENDLTHKPKPKGVRIVTTSEEFGRLQEKVNGIDDRLKKIDEKLFGNGKPGMVIDLVLLHENLEKLTDRVEAIGKKTDEVCKRLTVGQWLIKHWWGILITALISFVFIHSIIPPNITVWELLQKIL